jgi:ribonucleoside-diphosphate reductase beta chain
MDFVEPILKPSNARLVCYPIVHHEAWKMYKNAFSCIWRAEEIDLTQDLNDWNEKMNDDERTFIKFILSFFAASDGIVNENVLSNFGAEVQFNEHRSFFGLQIVMENVHSETYALLIQTYVKEEAERIALFNSMENNPFIEKKAQWAFFWMDASNSEFCDRVIAFACVEGIFFSASFCAIFYLKKRGLMPGLSFSNELISRDEGMHTAFGCLIHNKHLIRPSTRVLEIVISAVELECEFIRDSLKVDLIGMNKKEMIEYVKFVADRLLMDLGESKHFNAKNPFDWMDLISIDGKSNMFERRIGEYSLCDGSGMKRGKFDENVDF